MSNGSGKKQAMTWKWRSESPIEIILVVFILVGFFAFPRTGCGVTPVGGEVVAAE